MNSACAGWVTALDQGARYLLTEPQARYVLVAGGYGMSRFIDVKDKKTANLFADGAGAAVLASLLIGVVIALIKGVVGLRIKGLYFALFTLAFAQVFYLLAGNRLLTNITGAEDGFTFDVPDWLNLTQNRLFFYYLTLAALALAFWLVRRLMNSPTGRVLAALRDNESRAQMLGYNVFYFKLIAIIVAGLMATGAGVLRGIALKGASPEVLSLTYTFDPLLMTLVGG